MTAPKWMAVASVVLATVLHSVGTVGLEDKQEVIAMDAAPAAPTSNVDDAPQDRNTYSAANSKLIPAPELGRRVFKSALNEREKYDAPDSPEAKRTTLTPAFSQDNTPTSSASEQKQQLKDKDAPLSTELPKSHGLLSPMTPDMVASVQNFYSKCVWECARRHADNGNKPVKGVPFAKEDCEHHCKKSAHQKFVPAGPGPMPDYKVVAKASIDKDEVANPKKDDVVNATSAAVKKTMNAPEIPKNVLVANETKRMEKHMKRWDPKLKKWYPKEEDDELG